MLTLYTKIARYEEFLQESFDKALDSDPLKLIYKYYWLMFKHNLKEYSELFKESYLVPEALETKFLDWWKDKYLEERKGEIH